MDNNDNPLATGLTFRITKVESEENTDVTGFAAEDERITFYRSRTDSSYRCLVTREFSRDRLNWERVRFDGRESSDGCINLVGRLAGHSVEVAVTPNEGFTAKIRGNPVGTIMAKVD